MNRTAADISIGTLERSVRTWAKQLEHRGFTVTDIDVFRTGRGGEAHYGPSTVGIELERPYVEDGEDETYYWSVRFVASGYGDVSGSDIGGSRGWAAMRAEAERRLQKDSRIYDFHEGKTARVVAAVINRFLNSED